MAPERPDPASRRGASGRFARGLVRVGRTVGDLWSKDRNRRTAARIKLAGKPRLLAAGAPVGPDFICIGAQKGGTRWLYDQLQFHPDFWMPPVKEIEYLRRNVLLDLAAPLYRAAKRDLERRNAVRRRVMTRPLTKTDVEWLRALIWLHGRPTNLGFYARLFAPKGGRLSGDVTPSYSAIERTRALDLRRRFSEARIVYFARDPIERFWSQYCMSERQGGGDGATAEAVAGFLATRRAMEHASPTKIVASWRRGEGDPDFGLFFIDDLKADPAAFRAEVIGFLGGDPAAPSGPLTPGFNRKKNAAKTPMPAGVRDLLIDAFRDELLAGADMLGGAAANWPSRYGL